LLFVAPLCLRLAKLKMQLLPSYARHASEAKMLRSHLYEGVFAPYLVFSI
jgi:hypothetical protein